MIQEASHFFHPSHFRLVTIVDERLWLFFHIDYSCREVSPDIDRAAASRSLRFSHRCQMGFVIVFIGICNTKIVASLSHGRYHCVVHDIAVGAGKISIA